MFNEMNQTSVECSSENIMERSLLWIYEKILLRLMLLDDNTSMHHNYAQSEGLLLLLHRFFVLGAISTQLLGAMYFVFMFLLNILFVMKSTANALLEMVLDTGPTLLILSYDFGHVMLQGLGELWSICTRDNIQSLLSLVIIYQFLPSLCKFLELYVSRQ
jgi:hypothetical protein